jgi:CspA family cold shock protein
MGAVNVGVPRTTGRNIQRCRPAQRYALSIQPLYKGTGSPKDGLDPGDGGLEQMPTGTVKFFNADKGYGFIAPEGGGTDIFLHISALEAAGIRSVSEGDRLSYDAVMDERKGKTNAQNIKQVR